jgi:hypothetical protein
MGNYLNARNQEIYWRIAPLAYDEPITTLRGSVKMTRTQKPVCAITFVAPTKFVVLESVYGVWYKVLSTSLEQSGLIP